VIQLPTTHRTRNQDTAEHACTHTHTHPRTNTSILAHSHSSMHYYSLTETPHSKTTTSNEAMVKNGGLNPTWLRGHQRELRKTNNIRCNTRTGKSPYCTLTPKM